VEFKKQELDHLTNLIILRTLLGMDISDEEQMSVTSQPRLYPSYDCESADGQVAAGVSSRSTHSDDPCDQFVQPTTLQRHPGIKVDEDNACGLDGYDRSPSMVTERETIRPRMETLEERREDGGATKWYQKWGKLEDSSSGLPHSGYGREDGLQTMGRQKIQLQEGSQRGEYTLGARSKIGPFTSTPDSMSELSRLRE